MRFTCISPVCRKNVRRFNIIPIVFPIIFTTCRKPTLKTSLWFKFNEFTSSAISMVFVFSESFPQRYSTPAVSSYTVWLCGSWLLLKSSLNCEKAWTTKSPFGSNFILFMFPTSWTLFFAVYFDLWKT